MSKIVSFQNIFSDIVGDLEVQDSIFNDYLNSLILNLALKSLDIPKRQEFMKSIINLDSDSIKNYLLREIPDFENMLRIKIIEDLKVGVDHE